MSKDANEDLGLRCPKCNSAFTPVIYTRPSLRGVRRVRECVHCKARFTSYERTPKVEK